MKLHLTYGDDYYRAGYTNVDPFPQSPEQQPGSVADLDELVEAGEASEIVAYRVLDKIRHEFVPAVVAHWASKLAVGGVLTIVAVDAYQVFRRIVDRELTLAEANQLLYGAGGRPSQRHASCTSLADATAMLRSLGLVIKEQRYEEGLFVVKGKRP